MVREAGGKLPDQQRNKGDQSQSTDSRVTHTQQQERARQDRAKAITKSFQAPARRGLVARRCTRAQPGASNASQRERDRPASPLPTDTPADNIDEHDIATQR